MLPGRDDDMIRSHTRSNHARSTMRLTPRFAVRFGHDTVGTEIVLTFAARSEGWLQPPFYRSTSVWLRLRWIDPYAWNGMIIN